MWLTIVDNVSKVAVVRESSIRIYEFPTQSTLDRIYKLCDNYPHGITHFQNKKWITIYGQRNIDWQMRERTRQRLDRTSGLDGQR